jgi:predicted DsbA family dithiol-disulfide isomerase
LKIEVWFDVACPYCYIGLKHLENAINLYKGERPNVIFRSFELEPEIAVDCDETQCITLMRQYRLSALRARQTLDAITNTGRAAGLAINFDKVIRTNTFDAHRLIHLAGDEGKGWEIICKIFSACFEDGEHIGSKRVLTTLAAGLALDAKQFLEGNLYAAEVRADEHLAQRMGVSKVPFFLFDGKYSITGAQPVDVFLSLMNRLNVIDVKR